MVMVVVMACMMMMEDSDHENRESGVCMARDEADLLFLRNKCETRLTVLF